MDVFLLPFLSEVDFCIFFIFFLMKSFSSIGLTLIVAPWFHSCENFLFYLIAIYQERGAFDSVNLILNVSYRVAQKLLFLSSSFYFSLSDYFGCYNS